MSRKRTPEFRDEVACVALNSNQLFKLLDQTANNDNQVTIEWHYDDEDEMLAEDLKHSDSGIDILFETSTSFPFRKTLWASSSVVSPNSYFLILEKAK